MLKESQTPIKTEEIVGSNTAKQPLRAGDFKKGDPRINRNWQISFSLYNLDGCNYGQGRRPLK